MQFILFFKKRNMFPPKIFFSSSILKIFLELLFAQICEEEKTLTKNKFKKNTLL